MSKSTRPLNGPHTICLRVTGNSMHNPGGERSYSDGDYITVDPDREAINGSMVVVRFSNDARRFRQLLIDSNGEKILHALNPGWPEPPIKLDESAEIVGVVTGKWTEEA